MSVPSVSIGIEELKKWIDYWRKFKGKKARIWFVTKEGNFLGQYYCRTIPRKPNGEMSIVRTIWDPKLREIGICPCIDGIIKDVVDSPFGLILEYATTWHLRHVEPKLQPPEAAVAEEKSVEIASMFIPMSEIARIDFLTGKNQPR